MGVVVARTFGVVVVEAGVVVLVVVLFEPKTLWVGLFVVATRLRVGLLVVNAASLPVRVFVFVVVAELPAVVLLDLVPVPVVFVGLEVIWLRAGVSPDCLIQRS